MIRHGQCCNPCALKELLAQELNVHNQWMLVPESWSRVRTDLIHLGLYEANRDDQWDLDWLETPVNGLAYCSQCEKCLQQRETCPRCGSVD